MDATQAQQAIAALEGELSAIETTWAELDRRRTVLRSLIAGYQELYPSDAEQTGLPQNLVIINPPPAVVKTRQGSTRHRVAETLEGASPEFLSAREVLQQMQAAGWATNSNDPVTVIRNALSELSNAGMLDREKRRDGSLGYRLKNSEGPAVAGPSADTNSSAVTAAEPDREEQQSDHFGDHRDTPVVGAS